MIEPILIFTNIAALVISIVALANVRHWRKIYERAMKDSLRAKLLKPDKKLVAAWKQGLEDAPEHSPKWNAYKARLEELGITNGD